MILLCCLFFVCFLQLAAAPKHWLGLIVYLDPAYGKLRSFLEICKQEEIEREKIEFINNMLNRDSNKIRNYLAKKNFLEPNITYKIKIYPKYVFVKFKILPGNKFTINKIDIKLKNQKSFLKNFESLDANYNSINRESKNKILDNTLSNLYKLPHNNNLNLNSLSLKKVLKINQIIHKHLQNHGFSLVTSYKPKILKQDNSRVNIELKFIADNYGTFGHTSISGNSSVSANYIKKFITYKPFVTLYNQETLDKIKANLLNTGLFSWVDMEINPSHLRNFSLKLQQKIHGGTKFFLKNPAALDEQNLIKTVNHINLRVLENLYKFFGLNFRFNTSNRVLSLKLFWGHKNLFGHGENFLGEYEISEIVNGPHMELSKDFYNIPIKTHIFWQKINLFAYLCKNREISFVAGRDSNLKREDKNLCLNHSISYKNLIEPFGKYFLSNTCLNINFSKNITSNINLNLTLLGAFAHMGGKIFNYPRYVDFNKHDLNTLKSLDFLKFIEKNQNEDRNFNQFNLQHTENLCLDENDFDNKIETEKALIFGFSLYVDFSKTYNKHLFEFKIGGKKSINAWGEFIPAPYRYYLGGADTVRGYALQMAENFTHINMPYLQKAVDLMEESTQQHYREWLKSFIPPPLGGDMVINGNFLYGYEFFENFFIGAFFDFGYLGQNYYPVILNAEQDRVVHHVLFNYLPLNNFIEETNHWDKYQHIFKSSGISLIYNSGFLGKFSIDIATPLYFDIIRPNTNWFAGRVQFYLSYTKTF